MPSLLDDLTSLLVAHQRELSLDRSRCLSLVDSVWADPLGPSPSGIVSFLKDLLLLSLQLA